MTAVGGKRGRKEVEVNEGRRPQGSRRLLSARNRRGRERVLDPREHTRSLVASSPLWPRYARDPNARRTAYNRAHNNKQTISTSSRHKPGRFLLTTVGENSARPARADQGQLGLEAASSRCQRHWTLACSSDHPIVGRAANSPPPALRPASTRPRTAVTLAACATSATGSARTDAGTAAASRCCDAP